MSIPQSPSRIDSPDFCFDPPRLGKPDFSVYYDGITPRPRVLQKAKKVDECWLTVMGWLRPRVGKNYAPAFEEAHKIDVWMVERRQFFKEAYGYRCYILFVVDLLSKTYSLETVTKEAVSHLKRPFENLVLRSAKCGQMLEEFQSQTLTENLAEFADNNYYTRCSKWDKQFIYKAAGKYQETSFDENKMKEVLLDLYGVQSLDQLLKNTRWKELALGFKKRILEMLALRASAFLLGLQPAQWNPLRKVGDLIQEIREHGPLMMRAQVGFYPSLQREDKRGERLVYKVPPDYCPLFSHYILVVGAEKDKKTASEYVYFIDALDPSDPVQPWLTPVYKIAYEQFQKAVTTFDYIKLNSALIDYESCIFAWYGTANRDL